MLLLICGEAMPSAKKKYCARSICFAACWFAPCAAKKLVVDSGDDASFNSGKTNGEVPVEVRCLPQRKVIFCASGLVL